MLTKTLDAFFQKNPAIESQNKLAVAVSGGPDSMALAHALIHKFTQKEIHILSVDHGLRDEAKQEIDSVAKWCEQFKNAKHHSMIWDDEKPDTAVMQEARNARYLLMADVCKKEKIKFLFLGHHQDDQRETFFIRLAKGSGLDGLSSMSSVSDYNSDLKLARPFLNISKKEILKYCDEYDLPIAQDPSNENEKYLRPRLRQIEEAFEEEGFSSARISKLTYRLSRARNALEEMTQKAFDESARMNHADATIKAEEFLKWPEEIQLRVLVKVINIFRPDSDYGVRLEKIEDLFEALLDHMNREEDMKQRSLGYCLFAFDAQNRALLIRKEHE